MRKFHEFLDHKMTEYGAKFDSSELDQRFIRAYESGERIRVKFYGEEVKTGTVGVTTGWKPSFLLMISRRSIGSSFLLNKDVEFTTDKVTRYSKETV